MRKYVVIGIIILGFLLRFVMLSQVPNGLEQDETSIGYNAYSILTTGKDEHGERFPLYFKAFGEYKLPASIYLSTVPVAVFGLTEFAVRFPFALLGSLTLILLYLLLKNVSPKPTLLPIVAVALFAINPWHLHFSRGVFEVTMALFFIVAGVLTFQMGIDRKKVVWLVIASVCFALSVYTYNIARLFTPILVLALLILNTKKLKRKEQGVLLGTLGVLLLPFLFSFFSSESYGSTTGTLLFSSPTTRASFLELRSYFIEAPNIIVSPLFNKWILSAFQYAKNIASYASVDFLFISGSPHGNHGIGNVGQMYLFELPLVVIGIWTAVKERLVWTRLFLVWGILAILTASLTREAPHATRGFFLIVPLVVFSALGFVTLLSWARAQTFRMRAILAIIGIGFASYCIAYYLFSYHIRFPVMYAKEWRATDKELVEYINSRYDEYDRIIVDSESGFLYTSYLFYSQFPPSEFQASQRRLPDDPEGFSRVESFGKFEFRKVDWEKDLAIPNVLILSKSNAFPSTIFYYPKRPVVLDVNGEIAQYPVEEASYVITDTNKE